MGDVIETEFSLRRTLQLVTEDGQSLDDIHKAIAAKAQRFETARDSRLKAADATSDVVGRLLIALYKSPGAFERFCASNQEARALVSMLFVTNGSYTKCCADEDALKKGSQP